MGATTGMTRSHHGLYHSASIYQVWNGILPPTNPVSIEWPAVTYWGWYLVLCGFMKALSISAFQAALFSNVLGLSLTTLGLWFGARLFRPQALTRVPYCLLPFFVLAPHGLGRQLWQVGNPRIDLIAKFLNFTGFTLAVGLFGLLFPLALGSGARRWGRAVLCGVVCALICFLHPVSGLAAVMLAVGGLVDHAYRRVRKLVGALALAPLVAILAAFLGMFPYMNGLRESLGPGASPLVPWSLLSANVGKAGLSLAIPALALAFGAFRLRRLGAPGRVLWLTCLQLAVGSILMVLPGDNQYKLNLLLALPCSLLLCALIRHEPEKRLHVVGARLGLAFSVLAVLFVGRRTLADYDRYPWAAENRYRYSGTDVDLAVATPDSTEHDLQEVYAWLRDRTPAAAYVLTTPVDMNDLELSTVAQRRVVAARARIITDGIPYQDRLLACARNLVDSIERSSDTAGPLIELLALPVTWPETLFVLARNRRGASISEWNARLESSPRLEAVFANRRFCLCQMRTRG